MNMYANQFKQQVPLGCISSGSTGLRVAGNRLLHRHRLQHA